jgi:hypothetical protein
MATKKIVIEKDEGVGEIVDKILQEPDDALILVVPRGSTLGKSARNFNLIKRESADAGKDISVESVDENILAFAKNAGMAMRHPLLRERSAGVVSGISDIVPIARERELRKENEEEKPAEEANEPARGKKRLSEARSGGRANVARRESAWLVSRYGDKKEDVSEPSISSKKLSVDEDEEGPDEETHQEARSFLKEENRFFKKWEAPEGDAMDEESEGEGEVSHRPGAMVRRVLWAAAAVIVLVAVLYGITAIFGSAKVNITFNKTPWGYDKNFIAEGSVSKIDAADSIIPAQVFSVPKNITQLFAASGEQSVSVKAQGIVTIYNAYSSSPQTLVATTRFVTPDGKIFRLVNEVVVPGAAVTNGEIVPSSINASVVADQPGPSYNVSSTPKLAIPGFAGGPKYNAFYGSIASGTSGGFVGNRAVPTASDIATAKQKVTDILTSDLQSGLAGSYTSNFKILDGATSVQITRISVNTTTDANGNFSVFGEGKFLAIGFDETAFKAFLLSLAQSTESSSTFSDLTLNYASATPDFTNGTLSFSLNAQGSLEPLFPMDDFVASIAGKKIGDAKNIISALPELQEGAISVWPAWLWQIPTNTKKIQVTVD